MRMRFGPAEILLLIITVLGWAIVLLLARRMVCDSAKQMRQLLVKEAQSRDSADAVAAHAAGPARRVPDSVSLPSSQPATPAASKAGEAPSATAAEPVRPAASEVEGVSPETLLVIAAAVAAYLGEKVHVRRARLITTDASVWAQQGRVFIQASHNLQRARF
jgi:hypothetical protein